MQNEFIKKSLQFAQLLKLLFNKEMSEKINEKIINIFNNKRTNKEKEDRIKSFVGFEYVRLDKDLNGYNFVSENLLEYAKKCMYIIRVMKEKNGKISLYNYEVSADRLIEFILKFHTNELRGKIIEIEKYIPDDLA